jgi:R3H domain
VDLLLQHLKLVLSWPEIADEEDLDMNDLDTLGFYTTMQLFRNNREAAGAELQFPPTLTPQQRRIVHSLAVKLNLEHSSHGVGPDRFITVTHRATPQTYDLIQGYRPIPTTRASTEHLSPQMSPTRYHDLRTSRSMTNLRSDKMRPPPIPAFPTEFSFSHDPFAQQQHQQHTLGHRSSQESARSLVFGGGMHSVQPTRQPHGPQEQSRGFERLSREIPFQQIKPIGHGAKTPSHGSLSHGSGSRESRGGSDPVLDL